MKTVSKSKVFVGLSGGVDSAVSAALLLEQGYDVTGVFIKTWHPEFLPCTEEEDRLEAARVAAHLDLPFLTLDLSREYKEGVAEKMIEGYRRGETPNPDVLCNKEVKFGAFLRFARERGAQFVATGHYARRTEEETPRLLKGIDSEKDQSYFLWMLTREDLRSILFPVGGMLKRDVRSYAARKGLPNAGRRDSQGICFLGAVSMDEFLGHYISLEKGAVLNGEGVIIGEHRGAPLYTVGQRHGFTVTEPRSARSAHFVVATDVKHNTVTVAGEREPHKDTTTILLHSFNALGKVEEGEYDIRFRYRQSLHRSTVRFTEEGPVVTLTRGAHVPVGQSLVLYKEDQLVAGGSVANVS